MPHLCSYRGFRWAGEAWQGGVGPPTSVVRLSAEQHRAAKVDCLTNLITLVHLEARRKIIPFKFDPIFVFVVITTENRPLSPSAAGLNGK